MIICIVGMGYVGLPLAIEFAKHVKVIGYEINEEKVQLMKNGIDPTHEVGDDAVKNTTIEFTSNPKKINEADFIIVAVPTPINENNIPDLKYVISASETVAKNMKKNSIIVYESTVYPGCTEEDCLPVLEKNSGLKLGEFGLGYSPERINPGDKIHRVDTIVKVVSGNNEEVLDKVAKVYSLIIKAGVHKASSIKVAEAAKVIENVQRDLNIALMNELSIIFEKMNINTHDVIEAAGTKWNFHKYTPGLVGGHCFEKNQLFFIKTNDKSDILSSESLYELSKKEKNIEILSFNVNLKKSEFQKLTQSKKRKYSNLIKIRTSTNQILKVTDDHPIVIWDKGFKVKHAKDISLNDRLVINTKLPEIKIKEKIDIINSLPKVLVEKTRVKPILKTFRDYKEIIDFKKNTGKKASNIYFRDYMSLKDYLLLEKKKVMPIKRDEIYLVTGRGPSFNQIKALIDINEDFARMIGYYLSEGCVTKDKSLRVRWTFSLDENYLVDDLINIITSLGLKYSIYKSKKDKAQTVKVSSNIFGYLIKEILDCGKDSYDAKAPMQLLFSDYKLDLLKGIINGDGGVNLYLGKRDYKKNNQLFSHENCSCEINFFSISKNLFHQTILLLQDLGITCSFDKEKQLLWIHGHDNLNKARNLFMGKKRDKIDKYFSQKLKFIKSKKYEIQDGFLIVNLKEILTEETDFVYSFEVDKTKTLVTNFGLIVHNCIGVDPYYLTYKAQQFGYNPKVILAGREINDNMHMQVIKLIEKKFILDNKKILIMGLTFKENVPDYRNSRAKQLIEVLKGKGALIDGYDPYLDKKIIEKEFKCNFVDTISSDYDLLILFSPHENILDKIPKDKLIFDIKGYLKLKGINYISL
jgi:nucleotide sugar dehydrogenase